MPVVLYGCETWSFILKEERRLRVFENRMLRRIFWPRRAEVTGEWRKLHNEELNDLYCSPNIFRVTKSKRMRWAVHVAVTGDRRIVYRILVRKPERKSPSNSIRNCFNINFNVTFKTTPWCISWWINKPLIISRCCTVRMWRKRECFKVWQEQNGNSRFIP